MKKTFYTEAAYFLGIIILAIGAAFMTKADYGLSMVVAPAYILHLKISEFLPFFSFGMSEYLLQALIILAVIIIRRRIKLFYIFSILTAVFYGLVLDGAIMLTSLIPYASTVFRIIYYVGGMLLSSVGVSLLFHTYISPEAYELFVKEVAEKLNVSIGKTKTVYDCSSCVISIILSFIFFGFGSFEGVKLGTVICALLNGFLIGSFSKLFERIFEFRDRLSLRKYFEK